MPKRKAYPLRLSEDILEAVSRWAEDDLRSVNGQIEFLLQLGCPEIVEHVLSQIIFANADPIT